MLSGDYCRTMARYNLWMNERLYALCADLAEADLHAERQLFFGSLHGTLNHLLYGDIAWLSRFLDRPDDIPPLGADLYTDFAALRIARREWGQHMLTWAAAVDDAWLSQPFTFISKVDGQSRTKPAWLLVAHMFNHGTHHRGQLTAVFSQLGIDYGATDLPFMPDMP